MNSSSGCFVERAGRLALTSWLVTAVVAVAVTGALAAAGFVRAFVPYRHRPDHNRAGYAAADLARQPNARGQVRCVHHGCRSGGGVPPIVAIAIFLSTQGAFPAYSPVVIAGVALLFTFIPRLVRNKKIRGILSEGEHATSQTTLRWTIVLLLLSVIAADFGLDVVLEPSSRAWCCAVGHRATCIRWRPSSTRWATASSSRSS